MKKILVPLPSLGFDSSEAALPWKILSSRGYQIIFATPEGKKATTDLRMLHGNDLGIWKPILAARKDAVAAYNEMEKSREFQNPIRWDKIDEQNFDALLLPGGHDKPVKEYLESSILQNSLVKFMHANKPIAAVCHGVLLAARSIDPNTGNSIIHDYQVTCLLKSQEKLGYYLTFLWLKDYYLTYPEITTEDEVRSFLSHPENFKKGSFPISRDDFEHLSRGFSVRDRNFLSARWPGDLYNFSLAFISMLEEGNLG